MFNADGKLWASLNHEMPLLAEASPVSFLEAVNVALADGGKSPILQMFEEEESIVSSTSRHTGLLHCGITGKYKEETSDSSGITS